MILTLPLPPSVNALYRSIRGRNILSKQGREWYAIAIPAIQQQAAGPPQWECRRDPYLILHTRLWFPDYRRCDCANREKAIADAITKSGCVWEDDWCVRLNTQEWAGVDKANPRAEVSVEEWRRP